MGPGLVGGRVDGFAHRAGEATAKRAFPAAISSDSGVPIILYRLWVGVTGRGLHQRPRAGGGGAVPRPSGFLRAKGSAGLPLSAPFGREMTEARRANLSSQRKLTITILVMIAFRTIAQIS